MNSENNENMWDELFSDVLAGVVPYESQQVEALRRDDPEAARELEHLLALQGSLEGHFGEPESLSPSASDLSFANDVLGQLAAGPQPAPTARPEHRSNLSPTSPSPSAAPDHRAPFRSWLSVAATLLALVAAGWWWTSAGENEPPRDPLLLGDTSGVQALAPLGTVDEFTLFEAASPLTSLGRCELKIWDLASPESDPPLRTVLLTEPRWQPSEDDQRSLPTALRWQMTLYDSQDRLLGVARGEARRRAAK